MLKPKSISSFIGLILFCMVASAQNHTVLKQKTTGSDTLPYYEIPEVNIFTKREFKSRFEEAWFNALKRNVLKVYPYSTRAGEILIEVDEYLAKTDKKRHERKWLKKREKELKEVFEDELRNLTTTQGKILIKLLNRQTGNSLYRLIKELKSGVTAFFYQKVGKRWGYDLKEMYDPENNSFDADIEYIVRQIEDQD